MHLGLRPGGNEMSSAYNGTPQTSISRLFLTGHQMRGAEAGEGYMEGDYFCGSGSNYLCCSAQTSLTFAHY